MQFAILEPNREYFEDWLGGPYQGVLAYPPGEPPLKSVGFEGSSRLR